MTALALFLALAAPQAPVAVVRPTPTRAGLSWEMADTLDRKLKAIEARRRDARRRKETVQVSEAEVNSYLNLTYATKLPKGVSDPDIRLQGGRIVVKGLVDLDQVRGKVPEPTSIWNPMSLLSGKVPLEITGKLTGRDGFGTVEVETVYLSSIRVPTTVLEQMVAQSTRSESMPDGFDIQAPFRLPYTLSGVRVVPGRAFLEF